MIRCPKCQEENMIGVIFCRGCGEKLEVDDISPDDVAGSLKKEREGGGAIRQIVSFIVLIGLIAFAATLFVPPSINTTATIPDQEIQVADRKLRRIVAGREGRQEQFTWGEVVSLTRVRLQLTPEQVAENATKRMEEGTTAYLIPQEYHLEMLGENRFKAVLKSQLELNEHLKIPVYTTVVCRIDNGDNRITIVVEDGAMGRMPMLKVPYLVGKMAERHEKYMTADVQDIYRAIGQATLAGDGTLSLKRGPRVGGE